MIPRLEFRALANALEDAGILEQVRQTRIVMSALLQLLPPAERRETLDFLSWRARQDLS
jgi:hypothetical protein